MKERQGSNYAKFFSQTTHTYIKEGTPMGLLIGGGSTEDTSPSVPDSAQSLPTVR